ncbi:bifunctional diaminohydroxyphosphoribosylaminopyrimidine deaminase/5-amino-6-(5-phosphoribosylamino)uracil reductase RibD [Bacillaceae bacterium]
MNDVEYMRLALTLARSAKGQTSPNPHVGAVIVRDGQIVGMGAHLKAGEPHAEIHALRMAKEKANGSTVYVTLEPCSHYGRTPPCAKALIEAGVRKVVIADPFDPDPRVAGRGIRMLREAGIEVVTGILQEEASALNEVFKHYVRTGRPFVTVKTAVTLDGKIATAAGDSRWITGEQAREDVHRLRHEHDAILVGVGTVIADNPKLTTRLPGGGKNPIRVVMDSNLRIPLDAAVVTDQESPTWIFTTERADPHRAEKLQERGISVHSAGRGPRVDIEIMLRVLGENGITSLLVEGGAQVNGAFLEAKAIDKVIAYVSPKLVGGAAAPTSFGGAGLAKMSEACRLERVQVSMVGEDIRIIGYPVYAEKKRGDRA